jgi:FkbM family methyltransferase
MRHSFLHTLGNVVWVARSEKGRAIPLLAAYSRLKAEEVVFARRGGDRVKRTTILGMPVSFFDHYWLLEMFEEIFLRNQYYFESETDEPVILDVGSNIGLAILFFKKLFPRAKVIGFEPDPEAFEVLTRNVGENRLDGVRTLNRAVHGGTEIVHLYRDRATPGSPQISTRSERVGGAATAVPATRLSEHVKERVDFLKLDVEGAERAVVEELEQAEKLARIRRMAIEYHHHVDPDEDALSTMLGSLERCGFGYQLEARLEGDPGSRSGHFQNILVHAYRKEPLAPAATAGR